MGGIVSGIFGGDDSASDAAGVQAAAANKAAELQRETSKEQLAYLKESRDLARGDLEPFKKAGTDTLPGLTSLINDPEAQKNFITNNPFFDSLATRATNTLMSNKAAKGKVGSGGTAEALQNSLLLLGNDLLNQNIQQKSGLVQMGQNAAAGQGTASMNSAQNISSVLGTSANNIGNLMTSSANATAAGIVGDANNKAQSQQNMMNMAMFALSDVRAKENIQPVGALDNGITIYSYNYLGDDEIHIGPMAQEVEKIKPESVIEQNGMKYVNMETVWQ